MKMIYENLMQMIYIFFMLIFVSACGTSIPDNDTTRPVVKIFNLSESSALVASSEIEDDVSIDLVCPHTTYFDVNYYEITGDFPKRLLLSVNDQGGVFMARVVIIGGAVGNVEPADAVITAFTTSDTGMLTTTIQKTYSRDNPDSTGFIVFDIYPDGAGTIVGPNTIGINGVGQDFSNNSISSSRNYLGKHDDLCGI